MDLNKLNESQREAVVTTEGPLLVMAGAGSGKTRVLTSRIAYLIESLSVFPSEILAFTFTNKAAKEMRNRVEGLIGSVSGGMWIGTFHALSVRMLRRDIEKLGYTKDFVIYDSDDQLTLLRQVVKALNIDEKKTPPKHFRAKISEAKNEMVSPEEYTGLYGNDYGSLQAAKVYELYQKRLKANNAMDFDDLILKTVELLTSFEEVKAYYNRKFRYILVDEYQDTNKAQYRLIKLLANPQHNVCVVGDLDQSIYGWRGADIRNIRDFEKDYPEAKTVVLEQNYRSTAHILNAANAVIQNNMQRKEKNLWSTRGDGERLRYYQAYDERDEARFIAEEIEKLRRSEDRKYTDFCILYRTNAQSRAIEEMMLRQGIPHTVVGGFRFYERMEIKDMMSYLRLIQNPFDGISFNRAIGAPKRGIGPKTLEIIYNEADNRGVSVVEAAVGLLKSHTISGKAGASLSEFIQLILDMAAQKETIEVAKIAEAVIQRSGYEDALKSENTIESQTRLENLYELLSVSADFDLRSGGGSLEDFLAEISLVSDIDGMKDEQEAVVMMTLHSAKGLEYPVVFLAGLEENLFPISRALTSDDDLEEERRLAYVGMTRAEDRLYLSSALRRMQFGSLQANLPSRFLEEVPEALMENHGQTRAQMTAQRASKPRRQDAKVKPTYAFGSSYLSKPEAGGYSGGGFGGSGYGGSGSGGSGGSDTLVGAWGKAPADADFNQDATSSELAFTNSDMNSDAKPEREDGLRPGSKIRHKKFGVGTVISLGTPDNRNITTIAFDGAGIKKLDLSYLPVEVIE
ncbi:DNA helicase PcrA [Acidaminobacter sp.]|uniref:DNA helicase PcrA n=1 Tax=Acidaminobacter sp. TaxID=1872102 RepID=UPI002560DB05|nr:DNA helicase PcrA [Acidaminobacter sp.]MDK9711343.1 DNA helicase PcrA [Acidaminobacter sp.]